MSAVDRLAEIQARADNATDGPWGVDGYDACHVVASDTDDDGLALMDARVSNADDAEFIAHARTDVPALVAALQAVLDECAKAEEIGVQGAYDLGCRDQARWIRKALTAALGEAS